MTTPRRSRRPRRAARCDRRARSCSARYLSVASRDSPFSAMFNAIRRAPSTSASGSASLGGAGAAFGARVVFGGLGRRDGRLVGGRQRVQLRRERVQVLAHLRDHREHAGEVRLLALACGAADVLGLPSASRLISAALVSAAWRIACTCAEADSESDICEECNRFRRAVVPLHRRVARARLARVPTSRTFQPPGIDRRQAVPRGQRSDDAAANPAIRVLEPHRRPAPHRHVAVP